jgi:hypothetical protein
MKEPYVPEIRRPEAVSTAMENLRQARAKREQVGATHLEAREIERRARMNALGVMPGRTEAEREEARQAHADARSLTSMVSTSPSQTPRRMSGGLAKSSLRSC